MNAFGDYFLAGGACPAGYPSLGKTAYTLGMIRIPRRSVLRAAALAPLTATPAAAQGNDPLPSWRDTAPKRSILEFVAAVTAEGAPTFVPPADRIAVFDHDGTLWVEQPVYAQVAYMLDRLKAMAQRNPSWKQDPLFRAALAGDMKTVLASGSGGLQRLLGAALAGNTPEESARLAQAWIAQAKDPKWGKPYTALVYQPMIEMLRFLRARGFQTFIVSGGGVDFIRSFSEQLYGIPPWQVIGSTFELRSSLLDGKVNLTRLPAVDFIDDGPGKPIGIARQIGKRPIVAFGNSDGDFEMLQYTTEGPGRRLGVLIRHDDLEREHGYDRDTQVGRLARALDAAPHRKWLVVSMKNDWSRIFA